MLNICEYTFLIERHTYFEYFCKVRRCIAKLNKNILILQLELKKDYNTLMMSICIKLQTKVIYKLSITESNVISNIFSKLLFVAINENFLVLHCGNK